MDLIQKIWKLIVSLYERFRELFWYGVFGVLTTIINMVAFWLFADALNVHYMVANVIAWVIAVAFAYVTNKLWVFESKSWARSVWIPECIGFVSARVATGLLDMGLMYLMISIIGVPKMWAKLVSNVVVIIGNYVLSKLVVFRKSRVKRCQEQMKIL